VTTLVATPHTHTRTDRQASWAIGNDPFCTRICPYPFFEAASPGAAPGPPVKTAARVRRFQECKKSSLKQRTAECRTAALAERCFAEVSSDRPRGEVAALREGAPVAERCARGACRRSLWGARRLLLPTRVPAQAQPHERVGMRGVVLRGVKTQPPPRPGEGGGAPVWAHEAYAVGLPRVVLAADKASRVKLGAPRPVPVGLRGDTHHKTTIHNTQQNTTNTRAQSSRCAEVSRRRANGNLNLGVFQVHSTSPRTASRGPLGPALPEKICDRRRRRYHHQRRRRHFCHHCYLHRRRCPGRRRSQV